MDKLLISSFIIKDESIEGYILRMSMLNHFPNQIENEFIKDIKKGFDKAKKFVELFSGDQICENINNNYLYYWSDRGVTLPNWIRLNCTRYCPVCLQEGPMYHKYEWSLAPTTICPLHNVYLNENCSCSKIITIKDVIYGHCLDCYQSLKNNELNYVENMDYRKWNGEITELTNSIYWRVHLNSVEFYVLLKWLMYCLVIYFPSHFNIDKNQLNDNQLFRYGYVKNTRSLHKLLSFSYMLIDNWPNSILGFIKNHRNMGVIGDIKKFKQHFFIGKNTTRNNEKIKGLLNRTYFREIFLSNKAFPYQLEKVVITTSDSSIDRSFIHIEDVCNLLGTDQFQLEDTVIRKRIPIYSHPRNGFHYMYKEDFYKLRDNFRNS